MFMAPVHLPLVLLPNKFQVCVSRRSTAKKGKYWIVARNLAIVGGEEDVSLTKLGMASSFCLQIHTPSSLIRSY